MTTEPKETSDCNGIDPRPDNQRQQILKNAKETDFYTSAWVVKLFLSATRFWKTAQKAFISLTLIKQDEITIKDNV